MGKLQDLITKEVGLVTSPSFNPMVTSVGVTAVQILPNNPDRVAGLFVNTSANVIYIKPSPDVSTTNGIVLPPSGGTASMLWKEDFNLVGMAWYAVASGAASSIMVMSLDAVGG